MQNPETRQAAEAFVEEYGNQILTQLGYGGEPDIGFGDGWATNMETHQVQVDLGAFGDETYKPEWKVLGFAHELEAHHAPAKREPKSQEWSMRWSKEHPAGHIFLNIMADMAGNRGIIAKIPSAKEGWEDFYANKLFESTDYTAIADENGESHQLPRHIQLLYAMIRETFVPDEQCVVDEEVRTALDALHDFAGSGQDLISYSTQPFKTKSEYLTRMEQMKLWRRGIWPAYLELYDKDLEDRAQDNSGDGEGEGQAGSGESSGSSSGSPFEKDYEDYEKNRHPGDSHEHIDEPEDDGHDHSEEHEVIERILGRNPNTEPKPDSPYDSGESKRSQQGETSEQKRARELQQAKADEAGVTLDQYNANQREVESVLPYIQEMRSVFEQFINERLAYKRQLAHRQTEGPLIDPDNLAQTVARINTGDTEEMPAWLGYTTQEKERAMQGKVDFWLVVDRSTSMGWSGGTKARLAAKGAIATLEGLDMFNEMVAEQLRQQGFSLDFDARSGVIAFSDSFSVTKPLGLSLSVKERIEATRGIRATNGGTNAGPALGYIRAGYQADPAQDRKKVVVLLTDGEDNYPDAVATEIKALRDEGVLVYPIYIQSPVVDSAGVRIDDVSQLPEELSKKVQESFV